MADPDIEALLGPTLERGPCCERQTIALRRQIVAVLNSDACQDMSFRAGGIHVVSVWPSHLDGGAAPMAVA